MTNEIIMNVLRKLDVIEPMSIKSLNSILHDMMKDISKQMYNTSITDLNSGSAMLGLLDQIDKHEGKK